MKTNTTTTAGLKVTTTIKAGGLNALNHNRGLAVRTAVKAGGLSVSNHNRAAR
ncbi:MAG: hypothetical protein JWM82_2716 [Myxococcales bacterium]|nr:hypothetical protein [Myxococcales bacterium]